MPEHKLIEDADALGDDHILFALLLLLRDLRLWAESTPTERPKLLLAPSPNRTDALRFAAEHCESIAEAVQALSALRTDSDRATAEVLNAACQRIARWAHRNSLSCIALLYSEAAVRVAPHIAASANFAGRMARIAGHPDRSECWFDYGIRIAGRDGNRNRREMIRALLGKGTILREHGRLDDARPLLDRAARLCAATRRHRLAAETHHDLYALAVMLGSYPEAEAHMLSALQHYPVHHSAIPGLIHDWCFLLVQQGYYSQAASLLQASIPSIQRLEIQLVSWGTLSRAAAGAGFKQLYEEAVQHIENLVERTHTYAAAALAHAAYGARFFAQGEVGLRFATRARAIAVARGETEIVQGVDEFIAAIHALEAPIPPAQPPEDSHIPEIHDRIMFLLQARQRPMRRPVQPSVEREAGGQQLVPARRPLSSGH
ncbi:MAG: tetratricopeptide repeat protein [Gemmatimonadota bacterium]